MLNATAGLWVQSNDENESSELGLDIGLGLAGMSQSFNQ